MNVQQPMLTRNIIAMVKQSARIPMDHLRVDATLVIVEVG